jgi:dolichyl-diphosphooligosaccharide--protein glycosyltransferase
MAFSSPLSSSQKMVLTSLYLLGLVQLILWACKKAYEIRLFAINEYGRVIHEFDPYFNYRATEVCNVTCNSLQ